MNESGLGGGGGDDGTQGNRGQGIGTGAWTAGVDGPLAFTSAFAGASSEDCPDGGRGSYPLGNLNAMRRDLAGDYALEETVCCSRASRPA